jgi:hypothetical protein
VQRPVQLPVAARVEPMALGGAAGRGDRGGAGVAGVVTCWSGLRPPAAPCAQPTIRAIGISLAQSDLAACH